MTSLPEPGALRLQSKTVLLTGGISGIGRAIAKRMAAEGASLTVVDVRATSRDEQADAEQVVAELGSAAVFRSLDVTDDAGVDALFDTAEFDVVVNCAGVTRFAPLTELTYDDYRRMFDVNMGGVFSTTRAASRRWIAGGRAGTIVNVASNLGLVGASEASLYCASKAAVVGFTKSVAAEQGRHGIRANCLCPGVIQTQFNAEFLRDPANRRQWELQTPLVRPSGTLGTVEDVTGAAVFLASDDSSYMTGAELVVDGGWNCF